MNLDPKLQELLPLLEMDIRLPGLVAMVPSGTAVQGKASWMGRWVRSGRFYRVRQSQALASSGSPCGLSFLVPAPKIGSVCPAQKDPSSCGHFKAGQECLVLM
jgi:hypothetical protein